MKGLRFSGTILVGLLVLILVLTTACAGPAGPQGTAGPAGPAGPAGSGTGASIIVMTLGAGATASAPPGVITGNATTGSYIFVLGSGFTPGTAVNAVLVGAGMNMTLGVPWDARQPDFYLGTGVANNSTSFMTRPGPGALNLGTEPLGGAAPGKYVGYVGCLGVNSANLTPGLYTVKATDDEGIFATCPLVITK